MTELSKANAPIANAQTASGLFPLNLIRNRQKHGETLLVSKIGTGRI